MTGGIPLVKASSLATAGESERRILRGIATSAAEDLMGDVIAPSGGEWAPLPLPLLWTHVQRDVIGTVQELRIVGQQINIVAEILADDPLADRVWRLVRERAARGFSIGFVGREYEPRRNGLHWTKWYLTEVSVVACPANPRAVIESWTDAKAAATPPAVSSDQHRGSTSHPGSISLTRRTT